MTHPTFASLWLSHISRRSGPSFVQFWIPFKQKWFTPSFNEIDLLVLEKKISMFSLFCYYLPLRNRIALHLNSFESPLPKDDLCQLWLKLTQRFWRNRKCKGLHGRVVKTLVSYHETSHLQPVSVRILLRPMWLCEKVCQLTCGRSMVSFQMHCMMYLGSLFHQ
jgi:hypothetical protein